MHQLNSALVFHVDKQHVDCLSVMVEGHDGSMIVIFSLKGMCMSSECLCKNVHAQSEVKTGSKEGLFVSGLGIWVGGGGGGATAAQLRLPDSCLGGRLPESR